jgi:hypothetical protein
MRPLLLLLAKVVVGVVMLVTAVFPAASQHQRRCCWWLSLLPVRDLLLPLAVIAGARLAQKVLLVTTNTTPRNQSSILTSKPASGC